MGESMLLARFPTLIKSLHIPVEADGSLNPAALRQAAMREVIIRVVLGQ